MNWFILVTISLLFLGLSSMFLIAGYSLSHPRRRQLCRNFAGLFTAGVLNIIVAALPNVGYTRPYIWLLYAFIPLLIFFVRIMMIKRHIPIV